MYNAKKIYMLMLATFKTFILLPNSVVQHLHFSIVSTETQLFLSIARYITQIRHKVQKIFSNYVRSAFPVRTLWASHSTLLSEEISIPDTFHGRKASRSISRRLKKFNTSASFYMIKRSIGRIYLQILSTSISTVEQAMYVGVTFPS